VLTVLGEDEGEAYLLEALRALGQRTTAWDTRRKRSSSSAWTAKRPRGTLRKSCAPLKAGQTNPPKLNSTNASRNIRLGDATRAARGF